MTPSLVLPSCRGFVLPFGNQVAKRLHLDHRRQWTDRGTHRSWLLRRPSQRTVPRPRCIPTAGDGDRSSTGGDVTGLSQHHPGGTGLGHLSADGGASIAEWQTDSLPSGDECAAAVAQRGNGYLSGLVTGSHVCGQTAEGRVFRIDVLGVLPREVRDAYGSRLVDISTSAD